MNKLLKNLTSQEGRTELIGFLSILILIWSILYLIPSFFVSLFNTLLGNLILFMIVLITGMKNYTYGLGLGIVLIIIYRFSHFKEGFTWSQDSGDQFILLQQTINPHIIFDITRIKEQASQEELDYFLKNGRWPWSQEVKDLYKKAVNSNPYIRTSPEDSLNRVMTIYNQTIILEMLSWQTSEGKFLLNGVSIKNPLFQQSLHNYVEKGEQKLDSSNPLEDLQSGFGNFGYSSGLIGHMNDVIKCSADTSGNYSLEKTEYTGKDGITGAQTKKVTPVDYNELENLIPGFSYMNGPCNPCDALNSPPNYSCPFKLDKNGKVSNIWQYLWGAQQDPLQSTIPFNEVKNLNEFPLLQELKKELNMLE